MTSYDRALDEAVADKLRELGIRSGEELHEYLDEIVSDEPLLLHRMLCGCKVEQTAFVFDEEGFAICPTHGQRRYGWFSLPKRGVTSDFSYAAYTALERERHFIFGEDLPDKIISINPNSGRRVDFNGQELADRAQRLRHCHGGMFRFPKLTDAIEYLEEGGDENDRDGDSSERWRHAQGKNGLQ